MIKIVAFALLVCGSHEIQAQLSVPQLRLAGEASYSPTISAAETAFHVAVTGARASSAKPDTPRDSLNAVLARSAAEWLGRLANHNAANPISGIQLDAYGKLNIMAGQEREAERVIAERAATPGMSVTDKAYTYLTAILAFSNVGASRQLQAAERYLTQLDALGSAAATLQFIAHRQLASVYYDLGYSKEVSRHATRAVALLKDMEFPDRKLMYSDARFYSEIVDVLAGEPDGATRIAALNETLKSATMPLAQFVAQDSGFYYTGLYYQGDLRAMITVGARLGTRAQDVEGNYWVNLPTAGAASGPQTVSLSDGKIHILEMGHYTCPQCRAALRMLQKVQDTYPEIQVLSATATQGMWSNRNVSPEEEAEHLREFYQQKLGIRFPLSIWKGALKPTDDGGMLPENYGPNFEHYPLADKPNIYVIDGKGIIRRVFVGAMTPEREAQLTSVIGFLKKEKS